METVVLIQLESLWRELASLTALCEQLRQGHNELVEYNDALTQEVEVLKRKVAWQELEIQVLKMENE